MSPTTAIGTGSVTPYLTANGASEAIDFYTRAFGAEEIYRWNDTDGRIGHAEIRIGSTVVYLSDEWPEMKVLSPKTLNGSSVSFVIEVSDVEAAFQHALDAGATVERPITEAPYGRGGWLHDPFGHRWNLMTPNPNFKPEDLQ
jgi:PhnB protein